MTRVRGILKDANHKGQYAHPGDSGDSSMSVKQNL